MTRIEHAAQTIYAKCEAIAEELNIRFWQDTDEEGRRIFCFKPTDAPFRTLSPADCYHELNYILQDRDSVDATMVDEDGVPLGPDYYDTPSVFDAQDEADEHAIAMARIDEDPDPMFDPDYGHCL